jgi:excisionase family DNA binding protein
MTETMHDPLELLTVERVAGLPCCSQRYVYDQVKAGRLVGTKLGRSVKVSRQNLQLFLSGCETRR